MKIIGTGSALPKKVVTNDMLSEFLDTSDEWIVPRTGIRSRHIITDEKIEDLGAKAALSALEMSGLKPEEIDYCICSNVVSEYVTPGLGCVIGAKIGLKCPCVDINCACPGFIYALDIAETHYLAGKAKNVLIICAEQPSRMCDWSDRSTCVLFGDGAGAVVLGPGDGLVASHLMTKGGDGVIKIPTHYGNSPWYKGEVPEKTSIYMNGRETYKFAVMAMSDNIKALMEHAGVSGEDVALVIPHQANYRISNEARRRIPDIAPEKFCINIDRYGNTSSASVPILLDEMNRAGKIHRGDLLVLAAFGGGLSAGAMIIRF